MRAILVNEFGALENAALSTTDKPRAGRGELLIEIHATAANFVDILLIGGMQSSLIMQLALSVIWVHPGYA